MLVASMLWVLVLFATPGAVLAAQAPPPAGAEHPLSVVGGGRVQYFVRSADRSAVCGPVIEVNVRALGDVSDFEPQRLGKRELQAALAYVQQIFCRRSFDRTTIKFSMVAGDQVIRRVTIDSNDGILREEFNAAQLRNPAGEKLNTSNLRFQTFLDHLFYGRFDRMRAEDPGRGIFSWLYYEFISQYGTRYREHLKPPLKEYTVTVSITRAGVTTQSSNTYTMEERIYDSFRRNEQYRSGIVGGPHDDIQAILQRHAARSPAMVQLYDNLYRYAMDLPPIQDAPKQVAALPGKQPASEPAAQAVPRTRVSMAIERYLKSRAPFSIPDAELAKASDSIAAGFEKVPLPEEDRQGWTTGSGEQEIFNLSRVSAFEGSRAVARQTRDVLGRFMDEVVIGDPLLIAATCAFCDQPDRPERPAGFAVRFLKARPSGAGALADETLLDPVRFEGLKYVDAEIRDGWRKQVPQSLSGKILRCEYLPTTGRVRSRVLRAFWYHAKPAGWDQVSASLSSSHPLVADVQAPRDSCPDRLSLN